MKRVDRQYRGNSAITPYRGQYRDFESVITEEEVYFEPLGPDIPVDGVCVRVRARKRERERIECGKKKKGWIDRNEPVAQRAWLNNHVRLRNSIEWHDFHEPHTLSSTMSLKGWSIITQCSILERLALVEISRNPVFIRSFSNSFFFFCFEIKESWKGGEKVNDISTFVYGDWYGNVWVFWWAIKRYFELKSSIKIGNKNGKWKIWKYFFLFQLKRQ